MAVGKVLTSSSFSGSFFGVFVLSMPFLFPFRRYFASCCVHLSVLVASPPSLTFVSSSAAAHPLSLSFALARRPTEHMALVLSPSTLATLDAGSPPPKSSDLLSISLTITPCALQNTCGYGVLFTPLLCSVMFFIGMSLALVRFITAVCSLFSCDIGSLMFIYSCEIISLLVSLSSAASSFQRPVFSASSCSTTLLFILSRVFTDETFFAIMQSFTAVCILLLVFTSEYGIIRWFSLPLWQCEEFVFDVSTQPLNHVIILTFSYMEHVLFPYPPLVFSGCVAGSIVSKLIGTLMSSFRKGLANWCHVTYASTAKVLIVYSTFVVVSILGFKAFNLLSKSLCSITSLSIIDVEDRGLLHNFRCLGVMIALILCMFVLHLVLADSLAGLALLSSILNNCSVNGV